LQWAFRHQAHNPYGMTWLGKNVVTPDMELVPKIIPHEALEGWNIEDYRTVSGHCLKDVKKIVGKHWPIIVLGFDSYTPERRLQCAISMHDRIRYGKRQRLYPKPYFLAISTTWRVTSKVRPSLLVELSGVSRVAESSWRGDITGKLDANLDKVLKKLDK